MNKPLSIISFCFLLTSCATYVTVTDNPYTHEIDVKYEKPHKTIEGKLENRTACYSRHIKDGVKSPITLELGFYATADPMPGVSNIYSGYNGEDLDETAYVLINGTSFPVKLLDRKINKNRSYSGYEQGTGIINGQNYGSGSAYGTETYHGTISIGSYTHCQIGAKIVFTPEMERALADAEKMTIRVTTGGKTTIIKASSGQLDMIKELVNFTPGQK